VLTSTTFIVVLIVAIFAVDIVRRWWRENEWKRRWRNRDKDD
jgi:amino acid transporter